PSRTWSARRARRDMDGRPKIEPPSFTTVRVAALISAAGSAAVRFHHLPGRDPVRIISISPNWRTDLALEQLGDALSGPRGAVALDVAVVDLASHLLRDRLGDPLGGRIVEVHAAAGGVAFEAVADVEVLLEVVAQREVDEWPLVRRQLHRGRQSALHQ